MDVVSKIIGKKGKASNNSMKKLFGGALQVEKDMFKAKPKMNVINWNSIYKTKNSSLFSSLKVPMQNNDMYGIKIPKGNINKLHKGNMYGVSLPKGMYTMSIPKGNLYNIKIPRTGGKTFSAFGEEWTEVTPEDTSEKGKTFEKMKNLAEGYGWVQDKDKGIYAGVYDADKAALEKAASAVGQGAKKVGSEIAGAWRRGTAVVTPAAKQVAETLTGLPLTEESIAKAQAEKETLDEVKLAAKRQAAIDIATIQAQDTAFKTLVSGYQRQLSPRQLGLLIARKGMSDPFMLGYMDPRYTKGFGKHRDYYDEGVIGRLKAQASQMQEGFQGGLSTFQSGIGAALGPSEDVSYKMGYGPGFSGSGLGVLEATQIPGSAGSFAQKVSVMTSPQQRSPYSGLGMAASSYTGSSWPSGLGMIGVEPSQQSVQQLPLNVVPATTAAPISTPSWSPPVGIAPQGQVQHEGIWSPYSKKVVRYTRGPYRAARPLTPSQQY